jgi:hypothetical protein
MTKKTKATKITELSALAELLEYARLTAVELGEPFLGELIRIAVDESRNIYVGHSPHQQASGVPPAANCAS